MQDRNYFIVLAVIFAICAADVAFRGGQEVLFLVRKLFDLMDYIQFWR